MAEPRGRDGEAIEVKSAGGVSPPTDTPGGYGEPPPEFVRKNGAIWCILRSFWVLF